MIAGCVEIGGAFGGKMRGESKAAPKGMFENQAIIRDAIKPALKEVGADPMGQKPLPNIEKVKAMAARKTELFHEVVRSIMDREGAGERPWFYKCPKSCFLWPIWHAAFPKARWLIVRRDDDGIINSCLRTRFMHAFGNDRAGWQAWIDEHKARFMEIAGHAEIDSRQIWAKDVVRSEMAVLADVLEWLGLEMRPAAIARFVEPILWKSGNEEHIRPVLANGVRARASDG
jgi:hypothetical protein